MGGRRWLTTRRSPHHQLTAVVTPPEPLGPDKELLSKSRRMSLEALVIELGIVPISLLSHKDKYFKFECELPIVDELGIKNVVSKGGDSRLLPLPKVKDTIPRTVVPSRLPDSYCRGTPDHSPARATFPKDEIRREHAHNGPKNHKSGKRTLAKKSVKLILKDTYLVFDLQPLLPLSLPFSPPPNFKYTAPRTTN
ncbi:hypothetical protein WN944_007044 [Citrus x changshan-huyou]|uniref:Uncharacterized protein n=1 Tax=Citrus x changshan-huyou TaxID=2935761 RepID=A0AAP0QTU2_9ROSI